jgi:transposase
MQAMTSTLVVGTDVSQEHLDVAFCVSQSDPIFVGTFPNAPDGFEQIAQAVRQAVQQQGSEQIHLIMEPTGGYEQGLACFAYQQQWQVSLPNPRLVRRWAQGSGRRAKTDRQDALLLAQYGRDQRLSLWQPLPEEVATLQELLDRRRDLEKMIRQERNRKHALQAQQRYHGPAGQSIELTLARLQTSLSEIEQAIQEHLSQHAGLAAESQLLQQVPGVGAKGAPLLLALLHRWANLTHSDGSAKELTAYVGLDPQPYESGSSVYKRARISRQGNEIARSQLFMGAIGGVRSRHSPLRLFYDRLVTAGKPKMVALVAAARKILIWCWAVFRSHAPFSPQLACARRTEVP